MTTLSGSAFLQALGWAIAGSLWQMALLWMIYQLCFGAWRSIRASVKTGAATIFQFVGFGWFISSLAGHYWKLKLSGAAAPPVAFDAAPAVPGPLGYVNQFLAWSEHYLPYLSGAYLLVLVFLLARVVKAYRHVQAVRTEGLSRIDPKWRVYVTEMAHRIGIHRAVRLWLSEKIDIPATMGYIKPIILLPIASFNHLSTEQVEAILLHELAHIKRHDYLLNLVLTVMDTVLFFNPFAQLMARHIRTERENSCDDFVLQFRYNPHVYASALLSLERQRLSPELAMAASGKTDLLDRIKRIMNVPNRPMNYGQKLMALLITAGILASLAWLTPENIEHKPILNTMAVLLPDAQIPVTDAVMPVTAEAPASAGKTASAVKTHSGKVCNDAVKVTCPDDAASRSRSDFASMSDFGSGAGFEEATFRIDTFKTFKLKAVKFQVDSMNLCFTLGLKGVTKVQLDDQQQILRDAGQEFNDVRQNLLEAYKIRAQQLENLVMDSHAKERALATLRLSAMQALRAQKAVLDQAARQQYLADQAMARQQAMMDRQQALAARAQALSDAAAPRGQQMSAAAAAREQQMELEKAERDQKLAEAEINREREHATIILRDINRKLATMALTYKFKAKVLDQQADDDETGISADQPGWQSPAFPAKSFTVVPVNFTYRMAARSAAPYKEKTTLYRISADRYNSAPARKSFARVSNDNPLVRRLENDGYLNESCNVRIVVENNTLTINGQTQPESVYDQYRSYLDGKALVILSSGKVIQVTEK